MKNIILPFLLITTGTACNFISEKKNEAASSLTEGIIEKATGQKMDAPDVNNVDKNKVLVQVTVGGEDIGNRFRDGQGSVTASKESMAITINKQEGSSTVHSLVLGFTGTDLTKLKPIKGHEDSDSNDEARFTFSISTITENGMSVMLSQKAYGEIRTLNDNTVFIAVNGEMAAPQDVEDPGKWQSFEGSIEIQFPLYTTLGISKEEINQ